MQEKKLPFSAPINGFYYTPTSPHPYSSLHRFKQIERIKIKPSLMVQTNCFDKFYELPRDSFAVVTAKLFIFYISGN